MVLIYVNDPELELCFKEALDWHFVYTGRREAKSTLEVCDRGCAFVCLFFRGDRFELTVVEDWQRADSKRI